VLLDFGARVASIRLQLESGPRDVVLAYPDAHAYLADRYFLGGTIGRYGNRIRNATFDMDGAPVTLSANEGAHHLHGGSQGFHQRRWSMTAKHGEQRVEYRLRSPDGDQGYPGNVDARVVFGWSDERELEITYTATTDRPTHVNLTNHAYFNLGASSPDILDHRVAIHADHYTVLDEAFLPTGEIRDLAGTALDLRTPRTVRDLLAGGDASVRAARGADVNYVLSNAPAAATVLSPEGDLEMTVRTSCPGLQFYTGQYLAAPFHPYAGLCLESQHFPDAPNQATFPSTRLDPGQTWTETTTYHFTAG